VDSSSFLNLAELALALIGFSALVSAFRRRNALTRVALFRVRQLVEIALTAFATSLLPVLLVEFSFSGERLWRWCSLAGATLVIWHVSYGYSRARGVGMSNIWPKKDLRAAPLTALAALILAVLNLANASGWFWPPASGPYAALVMGQLGAACVFFVIEFFQIAESSVGE
jgi:hypothetical protein